ncbi:hypothetical protein [Bradyrhizobium diazoefficiens]|nr:hypothetical protein [Bradyrhizobium diazoefficiens]
MEANGFELSAATILSRCRQVSAEPRQYEFPGRLRTCEQYSALIRLFSQLDHRRDDDLLAGALAVYGWMPTMMDELSSRDELKALIAELIGTKPDLVVGVLDRYQGTGALRSVNNSIVGTSKLLHFFLPEKVAIWDSVLGRSFGLINRDQFHREDRFITYVRAVHEVLRSADYPWERLDIATGLPADDVSRIRRVEFTLYAYARRHTDATQPSDTSA